MASKMHERVEPADAILAERTRIHRRIERAMEAPVTLLLGPAGCGKSVALREHRALASALVYHVGDAGTSLVSFVRGFAQAAARRGLRTDVSFARAWERALQSGSPETALAHWICEHLADDAAPVVFDDLRAATDNPSISAFIERFVNLRAPRRIVLAARVPGVLPIGRWTATGALDRPIDETDLRFDLTDVLTLATQMGYALSRTRATRLIARTSGLAVAVQYALHTTSDITASTARFPTSAAAISAAIFARLTPAQREFLLIWSTCAVLRPDVLEAIGWPDHDATLASLRPLGAFIWESDEAAGLRLREPVAAFLARHLADGDDAYRESLALRVLRGLEATGRVGEALAVATRQRLAPARVRLIETHGFAILESGQIDVISDALAGTDATSGGVATALLGYLESSLGRLDTSEAWFAIGLETAEHPLSRVKIALAYARELMHRRRPDAHTILARFADIDDLPPELALDVRSSYAQALLIAGQIDEAARRTDDVVARLDSTCAPRTHARVLARAAYVALESGAIETARERAHAAIPLAASAGLYDALTSAYSVLYNIAYDHDDDARASMQFVALLADAGGKAGTLRSDLYAMAALYELHAEAGDEAELARLDRAMQRFDVHYSTQEVTEALLPAKARLAGWHGEFARAQRMLVPTADQQASSDRNALRWAEIALYTAAAGDAAAARHASEMATRRLAEDPTPTIRRGTTDVLLGLTSWMLGDATRAAASLGDAAAAGAHAPRLGALRTAVACIVEHAARPADLVRKLPLMLDALRAVSYGGFAALIEALPYARGGGATIGDALRLGRAPSAIVVPHLILSRTHTGGTREQRSTLDLKLPVDEIDAQIALLIDELDRVAPLMAEHSRAVSAWCGRLGRKLGLDAHEVVFLMRSGLIHDVGKILTPSNILNAPHRLTTDEWAVMKAHVHDGVKLVSGVRPLREFVPVVRGHHERIDGRGYPDGLRGGAIPLAVRIVTVADSFNAMIGRRSYQAPRPPTDALDELARNSDSQFDPEIVEAMVQIVTGSMLDTRVGSRTDDPIR